MTLGFGSAGLPLISSAPTVGGSATAIATGEAVPRIAASGAARAGRAGSAMAARRLTIARAEAGRSICSGVLAATVVTGSGMMAGGRISAVATSAGAPTMTAFATWAIGAVSSGAGTGRSTAGSQASAESTPAVSGPMVATCGTGWAATGKTMPPLAGACRTPANSAGTAMGREGAADAAALPSPTLIIDNSNSAPPSVGAPVAAGLAAVGRMAAAGFIIAGTFVGTAWLPPSSDDQQGSCRFPLRPAGGASSSARISFASA